MASGTTNFTKPCIRSNNLVTVAEFMLNIKSF